MGGGSSTQKETAPLGSAIVPAAGDDPANGVELEDAAAAGAASAAAAAAAGKENMVTLTTATGKSVTTGKRATRQGRRLGARNQLTS